jgi:hypothetical protein
MRWHRMVAYIIGCVAFAASILIYLEYIYLLGFPDGFITELGYAERRLAYIFIGISIIFSCCFIYLGRMAVRRETGKRLLVAIFIYLIFIISISLIDYYYRSHLMDGGGG